MAKVLYSGTQSYHNFTFIGFQNLITNAKTLQSYYDNTTLDSTVYSGLVTEAATYQNLAASMVLNMDKVYNDPLTNQYLQVPVPNISSAAPVTLDYLTVNEV